MSGPAVVGLATETDLERLRQMALLLEAENARLHRRLVELTRALAAATGATHTQLELEIARLQEQLAAQDRKSTGLNSSHRCTSYAVFCLKKKRIRARGRGAADAGQAPRRGIRGPPLKAGRRPDPDP